MSLNSHWIILHNFLFSLCLLHWYIQFNVKPIVLIQSSVKNVTLRLLNLNYFVSKLHFNKKASLTLSCGIPPTASLSVYNRYTNQQQHDLFCTIIISIAFGIIFHVSPEILDNDVNEITVILLIFSCSYSFNR